VQVLVITGGSAGIGQAAAAAAAEQGFGVVLTYRSHDADAEATVKRIEADGGTAAALHLDVSDLSSFRQFVAVLRATLRDKWQTESIHGLVNNAGIGGGAPFAEVTEEMFDHFHRTLFKGPYFLTQQLLPMIEDGGVIVNTGSTSALDTGIEAGYSSYAAQKAAMHVVTKYWAKELSSRQIRVNAVAPGSTRTRIADDVFTRMPEVIPAVAASVALGRIGEAEDVGNLIAFLATADAGWITGQVIECSGGQNL
jgi:NAD(P)-dependent dehydrogenase (short-subunit alcohol dehydrogenase family)